MPLPALAAGATPLQHLASLIEAPMDAAMLYRAGIAVRVPQPARFAVHKLIVAQKRGGDTSKRAGDPRLADAVIAALRASDPFAFRDVGFVQPGQDVEVKVVAFTFPRYGLLHGTVDSVSRDAVVSDARLDRAREADAPADEAERQARQPAYVARISVRAGGLDTEQGYLPDDRGPMRSETPVRRARPAGRAPSSAP